MQEERGAAAKYRQLETYLKNKGIEFSFVGATNYPAAANMFASGEVDAMFSGSGIAGTFLIKDLATPLVRPVTKEGVSTYRTVVAKKLSKFTGNADYTKEKVIFTPLLLQATFYHSIDGIESVNSYPEGCVHARLKRCKQQRGCCNSKMYGINQTNIQTNKVGGTMKKIRTEH
jgi:hypothetical protein